MKRQLPEDPKPPCYVSYASSIDLSEDELKYFHKPRVSLVGEMKGVFHTAEEDDTVVVEYYEQRPPLHLLEGMTSTIVADDITRIENTLFRAPMFARDRLSFCDQRDSARDRLSFCDSARDKSDSADYLMMIYANTFVIQPLPSTIYLCGQLEPRCVVPFPKVESLSGKPQVMNSQSKLLALGIAKYFNRLSTSTGASASAVSFATVLNAILSDYSQKSVHRESVRKEFKRLVHRIALKDVDLSQQQPQPQYVPRPREQREPHFSVQHLMTSCLVPEDVCAVQSCLAYEYYLRECCGINTMLRLEQVESWLDGMQRLRKYKEERAMQILATSTSTASLVRKLAHEIVRLDRRIDAGLFVYREMLNAPWNTTATFLECGGGTKEMDIMHPMRRDPLLLAYFPWRRRRSGAKEQQPKLNLRISFQEALKMLNMKMSSPELDPFRPAATKKSDFFDQRGALNYLREKIRKQFEEQKAAPSATFQETMIRMQTQQARVLSGAAAIPTPPPFQFMRAPEEEEEAISNVFQEIERKVNENEKLLLQSLRAAPAPQAPQAPLCNEPPSAEAGYAIRKTIRRVNRKTGEETVTFEFRACTFTDMRVLYLRTKKP